MYPQFAAYNGNIATPAAGFPRGQRSYGTTHTVVIRFLGEAGTRRGTEQRGHGQGEQRAGDRAGIAPWSFGCTHIHLTAV